MILNMGFDHTIKESNSYKKQKVSPEIDFSRKRFYSEIYQLLEIAILFMKTPYAKCRCESKKLLVVSFGNVASFLAGTYALAFFLQFIKGWEVGFY